MTPKQFARLSIKSKRRVVVEDAIAQIKAGKYVPARFMYMDQCAMGCHVCALGSMLVSCARAEKPDAEVSEIQKTDYFEMSLNKLFTEVELGEIEMAFEGRYGGAFSRRVCLNARKVISLDAYRARAKCPRIGQEEPNAQAADRKAVLCILHNIRRNGAFIVADTRGPTARKPWTQTKTAVC